MHGTYIGNNRMLIFPAWGGKLMVSSEDLSLMPDLLQNGLIEAPLTQFLINRLKPDSIVLDIGANIGYYTVLMGYLAGPGGRVIAYEANPALFPLLQENLSINYLFDRVEVYNKAIYSSGGRLTFHANEKFQGNSSIHRPDSHYLKNYPQDRIVSVEVEAEALDAWVGQFPQIDLVKMDIEGGEYHAFKGMEQLIAGCKIGCIVFEFNREMLQQDAPPFIRLLRYYQTELGARYHTLSGKGELLPLDMGILPYRSFPHIVMELGRNPVKEVSFPGREQKAGG